MKVNALLFAGCLALAATSTSIAQVYSENAVGFVKITVPANGYRILGNPLNGTDNSLNTIIPLPTDGSFDGASVYRYNCTLQAYRETMQWASPGGWLAADPGDLVINPGEGFFVQNVASTPLNLIFLGDVPSGNLAIPVPGNGKYCMLASKVPKEGRPGIIDDPTTHQFPSCTGDSIFIFDPVTQAYRETYQYVETLGWLNNTDPDPAGPLIGVAEGFFIQRVCPDAVWSQTFSGGL
jgi:hypothetical protein